MFLNLDFWFHCFTYCCNFGRNLYYW